MIKSMRILDEGIKTLSYHPEAGLLIDRWKNGTCHLELRRPLRHLECGTEGGVLWLTTPGHNAGNATWHPSGEYAAFVEVSKWHQQLCRDHRQFAGRMATMNPSLTVPGKGVGCDLRLMRLSDGKVWTLVESPRRRPYHAIIHPQFSPDGTRLLWAERVARGSSHSGGWVLRVAKLFISTTGQNFTAFLNAPIPFGENVFLEPGGWVNDHEFYFCGNIALQRPCELSLYRYNLHQMTVTDELLRSEKWDAAWSEHPRRAGEWIYFMSTRDLTVPWKDPCDSAWESVIRSELWRMRLDGSGAERLTWFEDFREWGAMLHKVMAVARSRWRPIALSPRVVVSDIAVKSVTPETTTLLVLVAYEGGKRTTFHDLSSVLVEMEVAS